MAQHSLSDAGTPSSSSSSSSSMRCVHPPRFSAEVSHPCCETRVTESSFLRLSSASRVSGDSAVGATRRGVGGVAGAAGAAGAIGDCHAFVGWRQGEVSTRDTAGGVVGGVAVTGEEAKEDLSHLGRRLAGVDSLARSSAVGVAGAGAGVRGGGSPGGGAAEVRR